MEGGLGVVVATYGSEEWSEKGERLYSYLVDLADDAVHVHGDTLAQARNYGVEIIRTKWCVIVDADDEVNWRYFIEMKAAGEAGCLIQPSTLGCVDGMYDEKAVLIPYADLYKRNYLIIGTAFEKQRFLDVGGFRDLPALEDWDLWIRMVINGASVKRAPYAIYIVNVNTNGRNSQVKVHNEVYKRLRKEYAPHREILRSHTIY